MSRRAVLALALAVAAGPLAGCGFQPLYAEASAEGGASLSDVALTDLKSNPDVAEALRRAFDARLGDGASRFALAVQVREQARPLAVQIDATVTRFNYTLDARYVLTDLTTDERLSGQASAVASFNVVSSQYSTLFAEEAARDKAARALVQNIERDILLRRSRGEGTSAPAGAQGAGEEIDEDVDTIPGRTPTPGAPPIVETLGD